jgi:hypothetical protein
VAQGVGHEFKPQYCKTTTKKFKVKLELPCDPVILLLGIYSKEFKAGFQRNPMFTAALFTIARGECTPLSTDK